MKWQKYPFSYHQSAVEYWTGCQYIISRLKYHFSFWIKRGHHPERKERIMWLKHICTCMYLGFHTQISSRICCTNAYWLGETKRPCLLIQQRQSSSIQVSLNSPSFFLFGVWQVLFWFTLSSHVGFYKDHCPRQRTWTKYWMKGKRSIKFIFWSNQDKSILNKEWARLSLCSCLLYGKDGSRNKRFSKRKSRIFLPILTIRIQKINGNLRKNLK